MTVNDYCRRFTDLSRYHPDVAANPIKMFCRFKLGTKKKWHFMATTTPYASYQEFYEILLRIEDSENMPNESEEEENNGNQKRDDKGKGQSSQGPRKTQSFKRSEASSSSSSRGFSATDQRRVGRFSGGPRFHRQGDASRGWARGDIVPYASGQYQYSQDPYYQSGYPQYYGGYTPYHPIPVGCPVMVEDIVMPANLIPLDIVDFDVILGTNWLHYNRANIDCYGKTVTFYRPGLPEVTFVGEQSGVRHGVISTLRAKRLELPPELSKVHDVIHVSMLRHYVSDMSHDKEPVTILDWKDKVLRNKTVHLMKVLWRNHSVEEATWETEDWMKEMYPRLLYDY
ncbi:uncharacterized protein [Pyrus communis]|uniref:uncharacterized protein n=1 Tax=Pyrus communis TaxID=23211 RepID=UPI0035C17DA1